MINEDPVTELEKIIYTKMPSTRDNDDYLVIDENESDLLENQEENYLNWTSKLTEFGLMYFVNSDQKIELENDLNKCTSSVDYQLPVSIVDYISFSKRSPMKDELATNYVLQRIEFNNTEDMINSVESTKDDLIKLDKLNYVRTTLWNLWFELNSGYTLKSSDSSTLETNKEIEFRKQIDTLKSFLDDQMKTISEVYDTKYHHYLKLLNDRYFYINNLRTIFNKIKVSVLFTYRQNTR